jgi:hypothetical protein
MKRRLAFLPAALLAAACNAPGSPIPVRGNLEPLIGEWSGYYTSVEAGRQGAISFTLAPGRDTASGDVLMIPNRESLGPSAPDRMADPPAPGPRVLRINFVRCEGNEVTGWMSPYPDPDTGEQTFTTFTGIVKGARLEGTYVAYRELSGRRATGKWSVKREQ